MKALNELITEFVDLFIDKVREISDDGKTVDMNQWYNYFTFDVIGELAFGKHLDACPLVSSQSSQPFSPHVSIYCQGAYNYWVSNMGDHMVAAAAEQCTRRIAGPHTLLQKTMKALLVPSGMKDHLAYSREKVGK